MKFSVIKDDGLKGFPFFITSGWDEVKIDAIASEPKDA